MRRGVFREFSSTFTQLSRLLDVLAIVVGAQIAHWLRFEHLEFSTNYQVAILFAALLVLIIFPLFGLYRSWRGVSHLTHIRLLLLSWITVSLVIIVLAFLTKTSDMFSRQWFVYWVLSAGSVLALYRVGTIQLLRQMRLKGFNHRRIMIIGSNGFARNVESIIKEAAWVGLDVVCVRSNENYCQYEQAKNLLNPDASELSNYVDEQKIDEVWLALPLREESTVHQILFELRHSMTRVRLVPDISDFRLINHSVTEIAGLPVLNLTDTPFYGVNRIVKSVEDKLLSILITVIIAPLLVFISLAVKLTSPGPVLFKQIRHGWDGKTINIYKFRTMYMHEEEEGVVRQASKGDSRITPIGNFLRRTSLDELPQFYNVLQGRMSIVGPRPHAIAHNEYYKDLIDGYMQRHRVKPGITGWAQIHGFRGETDTLEKMKKRIEYDFYYIENWSLWLDLKIILMTAFKGFINKNAY